MEKTNPFWLSYLHKTRQSYINPVVLKENYKSHLSYIFDCSVPVNSNILGLFPIADEMQTAFITKGKEGTALFFDVGQSAILKSVYAHLCGDNPETDIFKAFLSSASLRISKRDRFLSDKLGDCWTDEYKGGSILVPEKQEAAKGSLNPFIQDSYQPLYDLIIDSSILNHEIYHYQVENYSPSSEIEDIVNKLYDQLVNVAVNDTSLFTTHHLNDELLKKKNYERSLIKKHYQNPKIQIELKEEIACDVYAMQRTAFMVCKYYPNICKEPNGFYTFIGLYSIMFNFHLLHTAFIKRSDFYVNHNNDEYQKGEMHIYNLRRLSVNVIASSLDWKPIFEGIGNYANSSKTINEFSENLQLYLGNIYLDMCDQIIVPVTMRLSQCFGLIDKEFPKESRPEPEPNNNPKERLFLSAMAYRLNKQVIAGMFEQ